MKRWLAAFALALAPGAAVAQPETARPAAVAESVGVQPWSEAVVSVRDLDASTAFLRGPGKWRIAGRGRVASAELAYWRLPRAARGRFVRLCAPAAATGCIRYVRFEGMAQRPIRLAARPWDTGGIFSLMLRTDDTQALFDQAIALGWWAESEPYGFSFGGSTLVNVVITGPDGVNYALYQRVTPSFTGFPVGRLSQAFNSMRMVADQSAALAFYRDRLGFGTLFDAPYVDPRRVTTNFSVPANLATTLVRRAAVVHPQPGETGRIELMQFVGFAGKDVSAHAAPPNLGIVSVRFPVSDLAAFRGFVDRQGVTIAFQARRVPIAGLGTVDLFAVRDPDGNITEFYAPARSPR